MRKKKLEEEVKQAKDQVQNCKNELKQQEQAKLKLQQELVNLGSEVTVRKAQWEKEKKQWENQMIQWEKEKYQRELKGETETKHGTDSQNKKMKYKKHNKEGGGKHGCVGLLSTSIPSSELVVDYSRALDKSQSGQVWKGFWKATRTDVAIKTYKLSSIADQNEFIKEVSSTINKSVAIHPNVISYYGTALICDPLVHSEQLLCLVTELASHGSLLNLLRNNGDKTIVETSVLVGMCSDVVAGLKHLHSSGIIHGNLSLKHLLVEEDLAPVSSSRGKMRVKLTDFGLSNNITLEGSDYYRLSTGCTVAYRYAALEVLMRQMFTVWSDIWSVGVVFWEIFSWGKEEPYVGMNARELIAELEKGTRLTQPKSCPGELFSMFCDCWKIELTKRPSLDEMSKIFEKL